MFMMISKRSNYNFFSEPIFVKWLQTNLKNKEEILKIIKKSYQIKGGAEKFLAQPTSQNLNKWPNCTILFLIASCSSCKLFCAISNKEKVFLFYSFSQTLFFGVGSLMKTRKSVRNEAMEFFFSLLSNKLTIIFGINRKYKTTQKELYKYQVTL